MRRWLPTDMCSAENGTEPVIRVMVEAQSDELCAKYVDEMVQVIREEGLAVE
jgi:phosphoglucosamine mutase